MMLGENLSLFSEGNERTFREVHDRYAAALRCFASRFSLEEGAAEDAVQEAFIRLWERRGTVRDETAARAFLYRLVQRGCLSAIRRRRTRERYAAGAREEGESFLEGMLEAEVFRLVREVFEELPPACKEVYRLSLEGLSHEEVAASLGITVNTVKKHKNNAHHFMRRRLKGLREG
ncbi:MAG: sigma-70 family RNA polymerase sigma factor [Odoribacteraceae bacterium]|jgi:RNA polymerase sigma-70 factor (ECF subfamily)|nr:sigma-70 family RNA polymerase sigma factor [Odoribacteraceae bacterium]